MYVRVFQSIFKEIKFSIFYCLRHINYAWDPSKMATKISFFEFSILPWSKSNDLGGNRIGYKNLPDYPHPLLMTLSSGTIFRNKANPIVTFSVKKNWSKVIRKNILIFIFEKLYHRANLSSSARRN